MRGSRQNSKYPKPQPNLATPNENRTMPIDKDERLIRLATTASQQVMDSLYLAIRGIEGRPELYAVALSIVMGQLDRVRIEFLGQIGRLDMLQDLIKGQMTAATTSSITVQDTSAN